MQKNRVSQKVPNCNKNEPQGPFKIISRRCGWLRHRQVADFCSTNMNQFLKFAPQIWWKMKFLTISRKIKNQLCTWLRQNLNIIYHYWVKFWASRVISLNSRHVPPSPFIYIIYIIYSSLSLSFFGWQSWSTEFSSCPASPSLNTTSAL